MKKILKIWFFEDDMPYEYDYSKYPWGIVGQFVHVPMLNGKTKYFNMNHIIWMIDEGVSDGQETRDARD